MTDLTTYDSALVERVAKEICRSLGVSLRTRPPPSAIISAEAALRALGLIGPSRTAWIAPWEATEVMREAAYADLSPGDSPRAPDEHFARMRDAHLKEGGA